MTKPYWIMGSKGPMVLKMSVRSKKGGSYSTESFSFSCKWFIYEVRGFCINYKI